MKLIPIRHYENSVRILWDLLAQRDPSQNISHKQMPTWAAHEYFCLFHPYADWNIIEVDGQPIGAIYLSKPGGPSLPGNEIGIDIFKEFQNKGYGTEAVNLLMQQHGNLRYMANCAPGNEASQALFKSRGFELAQYTYIKEAA